MRIKPPERIAQKLAYETVRFFLQECKNNFLFKSINQWLLREIERHWDALIAFRVYNGQLWERCLEMRLDVEPHPVLEGQIVLKRSGFWSDEFIVALEDPYGHRLDDEFHAERLKRERQEKQEREKREAAQLAGWTGDGEDKLFEG